MDLNRFYLITTKIENATNCQVSFDNESEPNWADIMQTGRYCRMLNLFDDCIWCYDQANLLTDKLPIETEKKEKLKSTILSAKALAYIEKGDYHSALTLCSNSIRLWRENAEAYCNQGVAFKQIGDFEKSISSHLKAIEFDPELSQSWNAIGQLMVDHYKDPLKALTYLDKALELTNGEDTRAWINKGNALMWLGRNDEAIISWETAYEIDPENNIHAILNKAMVLHALLKNKQAAILTLNSIIESIDKAHPEYNNVISMLEKINNEN